MRRNSSTVVVLAGPAPGEVLAAVGRSMNVALIRPGDTANSGLNAGPDAGRDALAVAAEALQRPAGPPRPTRW